MGLLSGRTVETRSLFAEPPVPGPGQSTGASLRSVSLTKAESALAKVAIFAAVNLIASTTEQLPGGVFSGIGSSVRVRNTPDWLMDLGGQGQGTPDWLWQLMYCWALRGNATGLIVSRDATRGTATGIVLQHPDDVSYSVDSSGRGVWRFRGVEQNPANVWHKRIYPVPGRVLGLSPIAVHATTISQGLYAQNFGAQWFLDGAHPSAILSNDRVGEIKAPEANTVKQRFLASVRGTREPVVLGGGWKYQQVQIAPAESQFIETQNLTSAECARIYGPGMPELLGYESGGSMTYANISQRSVDLLKYTLNPWLVRAERAISELLPAPQSYRFDRDALLATDAQTRWETNMLALKSGAKTINEVRSVEGLPDVDWGNEPYLPALGPAAAAAAVVAGDPIPGDPDKEPTPPAPVAPKGKP